MKINDIIDMYEKGFSIDYITDEYYNYTNRNIEEKYFNKTKNQYVIPKKKITKEQARNIITGIIYSHVMYK